MLGNGIGSVELWEAELVLSHFFAMKLHNYCGSFPDFLVCYVESIYNKVKYRLSVWLLAEYLLGNVWGNYHGKNLSIAIFRVPDR